MSVFITATDTGVGKTYISARLAAQLLREGVGVAYYKPLSSGGKKSADLEFVKKNAKCPVYNTYHFHPPLAPYVAAKLKNQSLKLKNIVNHYYKISKKHKFVIVEGIGGALVPIQKDFCVADLIKKLKLPVILVARASLGTINHTLLTVEALKKRKLKILGIILNGCKGKDLAEKTNPGVIEELTGLPILAKVKWGSK